MQSTSIVISSLVTIVALGFQATSAIAFSVTQTSDRATLQNRLFGHNPAIAITGFDLGEIPAAYGTFENGEFLQLPQGLVISTGEVNRLAGGNCANGVTASGDPRCTGRVVGGADLNSNFTNDNPAPGVAPNPLDRILLSIQFQATQSGQLRLQYVFGSEEVPEYQPNFLYGNDYFQYRLNQSNPLGIGGTDVANARFKANPINPNALTPLDGYTAPFTVFLPFQAGDHILELELADAGDEGYDSAVFLQQISVQTDPVASVPTPSLIFGFAWMGFLRWRDRRKAREESHIQSRRMSKGIDCIK
jgi:hypothetical protein